MALELEPIVDSGEEKTKLNLEPLDLEPIDGGEKKKTSSREPLSLSPESRSEIPSTSTEGYKYQWSDSKPIKTASIAPHPEAPKTKVAAVNANTSQAAIQNPNLYVSSPNAKANREQYISSLSIPEEDQKKALADFDKYAESLNKMKGAYDEIKKDPNNPDNQIKLVEGFINLDHPEQADQKADEIIAKFPDYSPAYNYKASIEAKKGNYSFATDIINKGIEANPLDASLYNNRAAIKTQAGDLPGAIQDLDIAVDNTKNPHLLENIWVQKATIFNKLQQDKPLVQKYIEAIKGIDTQHDVTDQEYFNQKYVEAFKEANKYATLNNGETPADTTPKYQWNPAEKKLDIASPAVNTGNAESTDVLQPSEGGGNEQRKIQAQAELTNKIVNPDKPLANYVLEYGMQHGEEVVSGVKQAAGGLKHGGVSGLADLLLGTANAAMGAASLAVPEMVGFNVVANAAPEDLTKWAFAPATSIAEKAGYAPKAGGIADKLLKTSDLIISLIAMHKLSGGKEIKGLDTVEDKLRNEQDLSREDSAPIAEVLKEQGNEENIHDAVTAIVESAPDSFEKIKYEPTSEKELSAEKASVLKNMLVEKRPDLKEAIDKKPVNEMISEMQDRGIATNASGIEKYFDKVNNGEIKQPTLSEAETKRFDELSKIDEDLITDAQSKELEALKLKKEPATEKITEAVPETKPVSTIENKVEPKAEMQKPSVEKPSFDSADKKYSIERVNGELRIADKEGKVPGENTVLRVTKEYEDNFDYGKGKTAEDAITKEGIEVSDPKDMARVVAEKSSNPLEIIKSYQSIAEYADEKSYKNQIIDDYATRIDPASYKRFGDANNINASMAKRFFATKGEKGKQIDTLAQEISDSAGVEVTPADIIDFMENDKYQKKVSPDQQLLADKFKEITGLNLNSRTIDKAVSQELSKHNKDYEQYLRKEGGTFEDAKQQYEEAIYRGDIPESSHEQVGVAGSVSEDIKTEKGSAIKETITRAGEALKRLNRGGGEGIEGLVKQGADFDKLVDHAVKLIHAAIDKGVEVSEAVKQVIEDLKTTKLYKRIAAEKDFKEADFAKNLTDRFTEEHQTSEEIQASAEEFVKKHSPEGERKSFIETVKQGEKTTEGLKKTMDELDEFYKAITNKETLKKADKQIRENLGEARKEVLSSEPPTADKSAKAIRLIKHYESIKDYDTAIDILDVYDRQLRAAGQFIQTASLWNKLSPETMVRTANKTFRKIDKKEDLPKGVQKVILEKMQEIDRMPEGDAKTKATMEVLNFIADQMPLSFKEKFDAYRYQNMLSNPRSHERNIYANLLNTFLVRPLDITSVATYDLLRSPFNPVARDYKLSNAPKYLQSAVMNIPNAWTAAVEAFKQGYVADKIMDLGDTSNMIEAMRRTKLPKYLTFVSRLMESQDRFFSTIIAEAEKVRLMEKGLSESEATIGGKKIGESYLYRDKLGVNEADMPIISRALDQAGKWIVKGRNETVLGQALSWFVPFVTTPINVAKFSIERSPLGFIGGKYGKTQIANATIGTLVTGVGAMLAAQDKTTWTAPKDKKERELFYASGKKPYSIKINDTWVPLTYFGPYALALAMPAAYKNFKYDTNTSATDDEFDVIKDATIGIGGYISQQTPLSGLGGLFKAIEGDADYKLASVMGFTSEQMIPMVGMVKYVNSWLDPIYRKSSGYLESIEKDLPELSKGLPSYPTPSGKPATREPMNYWLPYDVGFDEKAYDILLQKRKTLLKKRALKNKE